MSHPGAFIEPDDMSGPPTPTVSSLIHAPQISTAVGGTRSPRPSPSGLGQPLTGPPKGEKQARLASGKGDEETVGLYIPAMTEVDLSTVDPPLPTRVGEHYFLGVGPLDCGYFAFDEDMPIALSEVLHRGSMTQVPAANLVLGHFFVAVPEEDTMPLVRSVFKAFQGGSEPDSTTYNRGNIHIRVWAKFEPSTKKNPPLLKGNALEHRGVGNRSFVFFQSLRNSWPPPLTIGPSAAASALWMFKLKDSLTERNVLAAMEINLRLDFARYFFAQVCQIN
jgi:hypothetical protein